MTLKQIENAVKSLPEKDLAAFRKWFARFDAELWDRQFEDDVKRGRLNGLKAEALAWVKALKTGYRDMAKDEAREREAADWADATAGDIDDAAR